MGKQELGETPTQRTARETLKETGVGLEATGLIHLGRPVGGEPTVNDEASYVGWFPSAELRDLDIHPTQWRQLRDYLGGTFPRVD